MQTADQLLADAIKTINIDEIFQKELREQIAVTVRKTIKDSLGTYSPFSKALDAAIEEQMKFDPKRLTLPEYSNFVVLQCEQVIKDLMTEERGKIIQKTMRDKLAPNLETEIEFEKIMDEIKSSLVEAIKEEAGNHTNLIYRLVCCDVEQRSYGDSWIITIFEGEEKNHSNEKAALFFDTNGRCYHSRGELRNEFTKRFASYVFNRTLIKDFEHYDEKFTTEDLY